MNKLRVELEAERHLRRETQQEAIRTRQARDGRGDGNARTTSDPSSDRPASALLGLHPPSDAPPPPNTKLHASRRLPSARDPPAKAEKNTPRIQHAAQALEALAQKRRADHALMHEVLKRQRRCIDHLTAQLGAT